MKIGVIGCGNMASAVAEGINASGMDELHFVTYTPSHTRAASLAAKIKGEAVSSLKKLGDMDMDMVIIGCKPHQFSALADELISEENRLGEVVSIMAAVSIKDIQTALNVENVVRLMPSLPMRTGDGISLFCFAPSVGNPTRHFLKKALKHCSKIFELNSEELLDKLTVITASGPAYVYYLAEAFEDVLNEWQSDKTLSRELSVQLFKGASMAMERARTHSLDEMIEQVTSQKGVTAEAIRSFQQDNLKSILHTGIGKARERLVDIKTKKF